MKTSIDQVKFGPTDNELGVSTIVHLPIGASPITFDRLFQIAVRDAVALAGKEVSYGDSWKKRGGVGAFMMLARKWDRIENQLSGDWDVLKRGVSDDKVDGIMDDIADLRRYLMLVEDEVSKLKLQAAGKPVSTEA